MECDQGLATRVGRYPPTMRTIHVIAGTPPVPGITASFASFDTTTGQPVFTDGQNHYNRDGSPYTVDNAPSTTTGGMIRARSGYGF
jgi:hypothetical protein